jgi:conjugative relaxase-like TrwC/TraI family protein
MIRVEQVRNEKAAKGYYTKGDYYSHDTQELPGVWGGKAAAMLGQHGVVLNRAFDRLCCNLHPATGQKLTARMRANRTPGYDVGFSACKSVSLLYGLTGNAEILAAFRSAVKDTMAAMEAEMKTRVRKGGRCEDRVVGNMAYAEYVHLTARPVKGVIDPQLHAHCVVLNAVFDPVEKQWKAGTFRDTKRNAPRFQAMFHDLFGRRLAEMGFPVTHTKGGWEIAGVGRATIEKFSSRTDQVNRTAGLWGVTDADAKARLGATTREHKYRDITLPDLRREWRQRLTPLEHAVLEQAIPARLPPLHVWEEERRAFARQQQTRKAARAASGFA